MGVLAHSHHLQAPLAKFPESDMVHMFMRAMTDAFGSRRCA